MQLRGFWQFSTYELASITAFVLWVGWMLCIAPTWFRPSPLDLTGNLLGADFIQFYAAAVSVVRGDAARLYDQAFQYSLQAELVGINPTGAYNFNAAPWLVFLFLPFSFLPFKAAYAAWILFQATCLLVVMYLLKIQRRSAVYLLSFFPIFAAFSYGQNGTFLLLLFTLTWHLLGKESPFLAGLTASLISYKPQFMTGLFLLWTLDRSRHRALLGACTGVGGLLLLTSLCLPAALSTYVHHSFFSLSRIESLPGFPFEKFHTVYSLFSLLIPSTEVAVTLACALVVSGAIWFYRVASRSTFSPADLRFSCAILFTLLATPYTMVYDLSLLVLPAVLLLRHLPSQRSFLKAVYFSVSTALFLSVPVINPLQVAYLPYWLHISEAVLVVALLAVLRRLAKLYGSN
jgi:hypothetical protein